MIIGITGTDGAGKGTVVEYLVSTKGFAHYSARAIFLDEIERQGIEPTRANMRLIGNQLRAKHGNDFVVTYYLPRIQNDTALHAVIDSLRTTAEANTLSAHGGVLLAVDADQKLRYERVQARRSSSDQVTFDQFVTHEELENNDPDPHGMQKRTVIDMADYVIENNGTRTELHEKIDAVLAQIATR